MIRLPLVYSPPGSLSGAEWKEVAHFHPNANDPIRQVERASIRAFVEAHAALLVGRVADFGAGSAPYRSLVQGDYTAVEKQDGAAWLGGDPFDAILCTQVLQYVDSPFGIIETFFSRLKPGGKLVMTYATNWAEVETTDLWRPTKAGMERMLGTAGFLIEEHVLRAEVALGHFHFALGYGVVARRRP